MAITAPCGTGEEWSSTQLRCVHCPVGTYQPAPNQEQCISCGQGQTTQQAGSTSISDCIGKLCDVSFLHGDDNDDFDVTTYLSKEK